jgi:DNA polymerase I-like protein with 3'-5' exonuclease and polymerase domains
VGLNLARLHEYQLVSIDTETTGLYWYKDKIFGVAIAAYDGEKIVSAYYDIRTKPQTIEALKREVPQIKRLVNHNIKFDANFLENEGIRVPDTMECTSVRSALINEHEHSFSLDALAKKYLNAAKVDIYEDLAKLFGGKPTREVQMANLHRAPESLAGRYAIEDPVLAIKLWLWQEDEIKRQELGQVWDLERKITPILCKIERRGVRVDEDRARRSMATVDMKIITAQANLDQIAGKAMNANSPPQMRTLFGVQKADSTTPKGYEWHTDKGFLLPMTETGAPSIGKDTLVILSEQGDQRAKQVLTLRKMIKAKSFLKDHILGHAVNGRVYPNYNQTRGDNELGTGTGRFSINDPALQQIPSRDVDIAEIARSCFLPEIDHDWCCADWAQMEFRVFAHYTKDPNILRAYQDDPDTDYHQIVSDITGIPRKPRFAGDANAKQINLGMVFGMGMGKMAYEMGLDYTVRYGDDGREWFNAGPKAQEVFNTYHSSIPGVSKLLSQASSIAKSRGFVQTIMGRHLRFPGGKYTHKAGGLVFQGSSADCMKQKMVELWPICEAEGAPMLLSVHDELDFSVPKGSSQLVARIKEVLETFDGERCPIKLRVPIKSSVEVADNWFEASK